MSIKPPSHEDVIVEQGVLALPNKVRYPIQALRDHGYLNNKTLYTAFMAESEPHQHHKLMYYIAVIKGLRDARIEVDDAVSMSVALGRKVNLSWSHQRWKSEHSRLARMVTLKNLASQSVVYDLASYERLLPAIWSGYLIKTSRRLGMEGLRQRHCVASYTDRIERGLCAIAVVLIHHSRWTVELYIELGSLKIRHIKGRYNRTPDDEVVDLILEQLKLPETALKPTLSAHPVYRGDPVQQSKNTLRQLLPELQALGISRVVVAFDGYGDSGMIEGADYLAATGDGVSNVPARVDDRITEVIENYIDSTGVDWYNDEGGYGEFTLDVDEAVFDCDVYVRFSESCCEYSVEDESLLEVH